MKLHNIISIPPIGKKQYMNDHEIKLSHKLVLIKVLTHHVHGATIINRIH